MHSLRSHNEPGASHLDRDKVIGTLPSDSYAILKVYSHRFLVHRTRYGKNWDYSIEVAARRHFQSNLHFSFAPHPERGDSVDWQD